ncbi:MAG: hypothetical protein A2487_00670 [Candidatus Raymondbacteria bacterium RifOxyC12_full_50_8]|uniref:Uncharacterized protein n=1 Tax=Candidatus Raymondbacteria bacterium RIFOXYD12_FULL_49_13 TaxID=1817890 RepID=A0A1F7F9G6_UNCRA|nr:MAG: hypothetical protein A2350_03415 [Candidatus Raymondbacteria bacterium RifOxyB12_full_50_8]OGJ93241.1 MAG: hypothetical protein A2248_17890 [Candidatus Raymondbacteria bacterium RIFOXYA2_FULL_49_16]OGJ98147.1 MAG: hypothetical protein A2487_00670 [Candidatus Raymondbacteria bacterium RifOxyC12_full_50_8]OGK03324.1 MAG: hypothetical protein A2519_15235 [Candidatus Raymondbacteria bacterium RIFOXYD12_FULL_49_13]OGP44963.1 MAG: hypothetical protein A2324_19815 [Candidatus Raymondbacteria b
MKTNEIIINGYNNRNYGWNRPENHQLKPGKGLIPCRNMLLSVSVLRSLRTKSGFSSVRNMYFF